MRKIIAIILFLALVFSCAALIGCGNDNGGTGGTGDSFTHHTHSDR